MYSKTCGYKNIFWLFLISLTFSFYLASCSNHPGSNEIDQPTQVLESVPTNTPVPEPTATALPGNIAIISPQGYDPAILQDFQMIVEEVASANNLTVQLLDNVESIANIQNLKTVILLSMPNELENFVNNSPDTQFILYSEWDIQTTGNLSVIRVHPEHRAFMAGYLIELIASDRRAAALLPNDTVFGTALEDSVKNGGGYFCGVCQTYYAPYVPFPLVSSLPTASDLTTWLVSTDEMLKNYVYVMYVSPEIATPELLYELARRGLVLVGGSTPPIEILPYWAATLSYDLQTPLKELLPMALTGQGGIIIDAPLYLSDINSDLFSLGRQSLFDKTYENLKKGLIYPYNPF